MRVEHPVRGALGGCDLLASRASLQARAGSALGSVSFLVWSLTVRIQGNKTFKKQTAWTRTRSAGSRFLGFSRAGFPDRTFCYAQSS